MKKLFLAAIAALFSTCAMAQTTTTAVPPAVVAAPAPVMYTKAPAYSSSYLPASTPCTPTSCSGFYGGINVGGVGTSLDIIGSGLNGSVFGGGGVILGDIGYQYALGNIFLGAEVGVGGQVSTSATVNTLTGNQNGFMAYEIVKLGGNIASLLGNTTTPITIPSTLTQNLISPYVLVGAVERGFGNGWATGAGATFDIAPQLFLDVKYMYINYGQTTQGAANFSSENLVLIGLNYKR